MQGNDKTRERRKDGRCHVTYFPFRSHGGVHCQQNRGIICQYGGVDGRKIYKKKTGFPWRKIISLCKLVNDLCPIDILTGEIVVEVTGVVGVSPALWYFRYIASIFFTLHKCLCMNIVNKIEINPITEKS